MRRLLAHTRKTNPVFYAERLAMELDADPGRLQAAHEDPDSIDLLTWNIFASLETHRDRDWLAHRLRALGGAAVRAPLRLTLWTGRIREPLLRPSDAYVASVRGRSSAAGGDERSLAAFVQPIEVPVRIESPDTLVLVDTVGREYPRGAGGRDRVVELIDAGLDHARRLSRSLAVAVVYPSGTQAAAELSARVNELRDPATLRAALPHRRSVPQVVLREISWSTLARVWLLELDHLRLAGQPVRAFRALLADRGFV